MPFSLNWGEKVYAKIIAGNIVGDSLASPVGDGATILTVPDAPINVANVASITNGETIGLTWAAGIAEGGAPLIDYRIQYETGDGIYIELVSGLTTTSYTAIGMTRGVVHNVVVQARNIYGYSAYSTVVPILTA